MEGCLRTSGWPSEWRKAFGNRDGAGVFSVGLELGLAEYSVKGRLLWTPFGIAVGAIEVRLPN